MTMILALFMSFGARAEWFCNSQSSQVFSTTAEACGVGNGQTEAQARLDAFDQAEAEAVKLGFSSNPVPMRTECATSQAGFKCYRMVRFERGLAGTSIASNRVMNVIEGNGYSQVFLNKDQCVYSGCYLIMQDGKVTKSVDVKKDSQ